MDYVMRRLMLRFKPTSTTSLNFQVGGPHKASPPSTPNPCSLDSNWGPKLSKTTFIPLMMFSKKKSVRPPDNEYFH